MRDRFPVIGVLLALALAFVMVVLTRTASGATGIAALPAVARPTNKPQQSAEERGPLLTRRPTLSSRQIAFEFAGEIWVVPREGGAAQRLVSGQLRNSLPAFSPDGSQIAFTGTFDQNPDVYVIAAGGGVPRRLTWHPGPDVVTGWTPDGKSVLFSSMRASPRDIPRLFTVPLTGGLPTELPLPSGVTGAFSPDGKRLAYVPFPQWEPGWRQYRGGQTSRVWIADLADSSIVKVPRENSNDSCAGWLGDTVYFVSDRNGPATLFGYDLKSGEVRELVHNPDGFDVRWAAAGPGAIVYEQLGQLSLYDLTSGKSTKVPLTLDADLPQVRARFVPVEPEQILHAAVSPTGKRVLFETRGEVLSVPAEKGDTRNLTQSPGSADRDPTWSPDGKWIAWLSDQSGEYALYFQSPDGLGPQRRVALGEPPSFFYRPRWSPDSRKIAIADKRLNLWVIDLDAPRPSLAKVDSDRYDTPLTNLDANWSPDSKWIAYVKQLPNHLHAIYLHSLKTRTSHQVTDGRSDAWSPRFDRGGEDLWFLATTATGQAAGWLDMTSMGRPITTSVYGLVLSKDSPSPVAPESDEESADAGAAPKPPDPHAPAEAVPAVKVDLADLDQRVVALPIERANYASLEVGPAGVLFLLTAPLAMADEDYIDLGESAPPFAVSRFDLKTRKTEKFLEKIDGQLAAYDPLITFEATADGSKVLYAAGKKWFLVPSDKAPKADEGEVKLAAVEVWVDPSAEWRQMFHEVWRIQRDFLYDPRAHGLDLAATERLYEPFVAGIGGRDDLNALFEDMLANLVLGHVWAEGGALPRQTPLTVGQLGARFERAEGRYRIASILKSEGWNPKLKAPLTQPGVNVRAGEYLLAVQGQELTADDDVNRLFLGRAEKQTTLRVGPRADGQDSRNVTVVPVADEAGLRLRAWMEGNRQRVDELSGGRVGYVFIPDTYAGGLTNFNRYYFSQVGKEAVVLDERFNHGGNIADYIINALKWTPQMAVASREGDDVVEPAQGLFGPKVMIANEMSGSGGDALPWLFKRAKLGPLVGTRTWGGLVGIGGYPRLIDGGGVTAPRWGLYGPDGKWEVENVGVSPDVEVEQDPALTRIGHDPQLEKAVALALEALKQSPPVKLVRPPYPDYHQRLPKR